MWEDVNCVHPGQVSVAESCEHGNEPSGSIKGKDFLG